ncbi:hypothetical protein RV11_GL003066 [Enterococcus phoeniculicola]|jgi:integrase|uniref:Tyr recombinase domain-containing protein n=1 Tax=Enterococcus phoeniculicola ATCC BAA-412 TaxID=1158610 RepID=R3U615_9ENTE|nr:site-specific integrase [Enterococcus phoeniculicola]EOL40592.1 hypothetical protein UC3_03581 [Enterococcus phoeniculicola ATCC BAA-412]EOL48868.1 hypothetical protein UC3_00419 [Enterococcus phoeniculicola ATCC BAA-412]EOT72714.1 hypothetical protein I589_02983 [Enterococcus phoeniculicola ATCC BAA-412]OJG68168.1 hypothetical protein RV11_GL003066 [Enterococcus phoeniculicola]
MKRGENIYKRKDGRWEGRYIKGKNELGKTKYGYVYGRSYQEAQRKLYPLKLKYFAIREIRGSTTLPFDVLATYWLKDQLETVKPSTYASYQYKLTHYVSPIIGRIPLNELTRLDGQQLIWTLRKTLQISTIQIIMGIVKACLNYAQEIGYLENNPFRFVKLPKKRKEKVRALKRSEQKTLMKVAVEEEKNHGLTTITALLTGMRIGELAALKWTDIDFDENIISVSHTYQRINLEKGTKKTQLLYNSAKTEGSARVIPLGQTLKQLLLTHAEKKESAIFVFGKGETATEPRTLTYHFNRIRKKANLPDVHFHQLRHTFATRCLEVSKNISSVSAVMGHASTQMTLDVYGDSMIETRLDMLEKMEACLA